MFQHATPESCGISSEAVLNCFKHFEKLELSTHSLIMARGDKIFAEGYYAPFHKDFKHRMYSVSKSFVSIAIGFCLQDGLLTLEDKFLDYFPEYDHGEDISLLQEQTIRDMLCMTTCKTDDRWWFGTGTDDRTKEYFPESNNKIPGTLWEYDSPGSYMLNVIVEKLTRKPFMEYLKEKCLNEIGFSKDSYCLTVPGGHSFGDSGIMCTAYDLLLFARFVMNLGKWKNKQLLDENYVREATSKKTSNRESGNFDYYHSGYGYQIWKTPDDGFAFVGMGNQFAVCHPKTDSIFIITSDDQGNVPARHFILDDFYKIIESFGDALPENETAYKTLTDHLASLKLVSLKGDTASETADFVNGKVYTLSENPMGIKWFKLSFNGNKGILHYENAQGEKELVFGMGYNEFSKFPEENYSDLIATVPEPGHKYDCAVSGIWEDTNELLLKVQIIDKYFGRMSMRFSFKDNRVSVAMEKVAEAFLTKYTGSAVGEAK
ncbi:MAG: serine hydrolase [Clostridia bacterium]|nr:serine hydrolase [Clostridia bacterium]